jgi:5-methylthioribose kinase
VYTGNLIRVDDVVESLKLAHRWKSYRLIHGDAGLRNVFITPEGARCCDLEDVSLGPRGWDVGWLGGNHLKPFEPINRDLLPILSDLRSLCVAVCQE